MRLFLVGLLLVLAAGCRNPDDERFIEQFRAGGMRACMKGEGLMRPHWAVPPDQLAASCTCIVYAFMENKTRRELEHLSVGDQLRAREQCSHGAPEAPGPGEAEAMDDATNAILNAAEMSPAAGGNASGGKK